MAFVGWVDDKLVVVGVRGFDDASLVLVVGIAVGTLLLGVAVGVVVRVVVGTLLHDVAVGVVVGTLLVEMVVVGVVVGTLLVEVVVRVSRSWVYRDQSTLEWNRKV